MKEFFSTSGTSGIDHLDGVAVVVQAPQTRLTPTQRYIFDSIIEVFKESAKNLFLMVTFADGQRPPVVAAAKAAGVPCSNPIYKFNNSALFAPNEAGDDEESLTKIFWKMGDNSFRAFLPKLYMTTSVSIQLSKEVLREREQLQTTLKGLRSQINKSLAHLDVLQQETKIVQQYEAMIEGSEYEVEVIKLHQKDLEEGQKVMNCTCCKVTCDDDYTGTNVMKNGCCQVCAGSCKCDEHCSASYKYVYYTEREVRTREDLKRRYNITREGKTEVQNIMAGLEQELRSAHENISAMMDRAQLCLNRLKQIALMNDPLSRTDFLDLLIRLEKQEAKPGWKQQLAYLQASREQY